jgi:glycine/D-amino acid oxidase-like deaminating enzyme
VIRGIYGPSEVYTRLTARALELWKTAQREWKPEVYHQAGVLWFSGKDDAYVRQSLPHLQKHGFRYRELEVKDAAQQFPQVDFSGISSVVHELDAGFLMAREACMQVVEQFQREGGHYKIGETRFGKDGVQFLDGSRLDAEAFVFACGPWLGKLFPDMIGERVARPAHAAGSAVLRRACGR